MHPSEHAAGKLIVHIYRQSKILRTNAELLQSLYGIGSLPCAFFCIQRLREYVCSAHYSVRLGVGILACKIVIVVQYQVALAVRCPCDSHYGEIHSRSSGACKVAVLGLPVRYIHAVDDKVSCEPSVVIIRGISHIAERARVSEFRCGICRINCRQDSCHQTQRQNQCHDRAKQILCFLTGFVIFHFFFPSILRKLRPPDCRLRIFQVS